MTIQFAKVNPYNDVIFEDVIASMPLEKQREIWMEAYKALLQTDGLKQHVDVLTWADQCLEAYAHRFYFQENKKDLE